MLDRRTLVAALSIGACPSMASTAFAGSAKTDTSTLALRAIPSTGERIPVVGLGTYIAFDLATTDPDWPQAREALQAFAEHHGRVIDTSPMYGEAESAIGKMVAGLNIAPKLFLASKVWTSGKQDGIAQMEATFQALRTKCVDLMQVHNLLDVETQLATLADWKAAGRIRYIGVTHYESSAYFALEEVMRRHKLDFIEINYSALEREAEKRILPLAQHSGVAVVVDRPFAGGGLLGRLRAVPLPAWAADIGCTSWAQIALKFVVSHPTVTVAVPGSREARHVAENLSAGSGIQPDEKLRERIVREISAA